MDLKSFVINTLRRSFYKYPSRKEALKKSRVARGQYKCAMCEELFKPKEIQVDHIDSVIPTEGFPDNKFDWNIYIDRLFCNEQGLQILCKQCHKDKTYLENELRREHKSLKVWGKG